AVGQTFMNGSSVAFDYGSVTYGSSALLSGDLTFGWEDPSSGLSTSGPVVGSVNYYQWNGTTVSLDLSSAWTLLGNSASAASGFDLPITFPTGENIFLSLPLDSSSEPIFIDGVGGYNDAESIVADVVTYVPEPST